MMHESSKNIFFVQVLLFLFFFSSDFSLKTGSCCVMRGLSQRIEDLFLIVSQGQPRCKFSKC